MINDNDELFRLVSGRYIMDERLSKCMFLIKNAHPETPPADNTGYSWDEAGMADLFAECYQSQAKYCPEAKAWYTYAGGRWILDEGELKVSEMLKEFARLMGLYCFEIADEDKRGAYQKAVVARMGDRRFRDRILKDARSVPLIEVKARDFDANPYLINCINGTFDLRTMTFREYDPRDLITMQTNFEYTVQTDVVCERWEQFIGEITNCDRDKADYLQRAAGYSLLGEANEECMFILWGKTTRNGKSTFLGTIHHLLGGYSRVSPVAIICKADRAKNAEAPSPVLAELKGKRFVTMAESNQYGRFDEEAIKQLTGGEEIVARKLYQAPVSFLPQFTMWLSCNDLPAVYDRSLFASDRLRVVEFDRHFTEEERDETLKDSFKTPKAMMGIFHWLLEGYRKYRKHGLKMSSALREVIKQYETDNDIVLQFLDDRCEPSDGEIKSSELYFIFQKWCERNGYKSVMTNKKFTAAMDSHPERHKGRIRKSDGTYFIGISLRST